MQIDWSHFTPWSALGGGILIGLAAAWFILVDGRILGACGVLAGLITPLRGDWAWRLCLIAGLIASPLLARLLFGAAGGIIASPLPIVILAGLLVGFGTRLGNGCTSGHGVCGLARLSPRSAVATGVFMAAAFLTVFLTRHIFG
jgi:uncharacterized membrane protein YedE/YeeE